MRSDDITNHRLEDACVVDDRTRLGLCEDEAIGLDAKGSLLGEQMVRIDDAEHLGRSDAAAVHRLDRRPNGTSRSSRSDVADVCVMMGYESFGQISDERVCERGRQSTFREALDDPDVVIRRHHIEKTIADPVRFDNTLIERIIDPVALCDHRKVRVEAFEAREQTCELLVIEVRVTDEEPTEGFDRLSRSSVAHRVGDRTEPDAQFETTTHALTLNGSSRAM